jgi:transposase-like protein
MDCPHCHSSSTTEREGRTVHGFRRFRCRECGRRFNERTGTALNRVQVPTDIIFLVVFWRLRYKLSLRDLAEMFLIRGIVFTHEAVRDWEAKLAPMLAEGLRKRRAGNGAGTSTRPTSKSPANGAISIGRSTATAIWSTST